MDSFDLYYSHVGLTFAADLQILRVHAVFHEAEEDGLALHYILDKLDMDHFSKAVEMIKSSPTPPLEVTSPPVEKPNPIDSKEKKTKRGKVAKAVITKASRKHHIKKPLDVVASLYMNTEPKIQVSFILCNVLKRKIPDLSKCFKKHDELETYLECLSSIKDVWERRWRSAAATVCSWSSSHRCALC